MRRLWEYNPGSSSAVRVAAVPTTAGRAATKGWVLFIASTHVRKKTGRGKHKDNTMRRVKQRSAAHLCL